MVVLRPNLSILPWLKLVQTRLSSFESQPKKVVVVIVVGGVVVFVAFILGHRNLTKVWSKSDQYVIYCCCYYFSFVVIVINVVVDPET